MIDADGKVVEVIDLEDDSVQEDKAFNNSERKHVSLIISVCFHKPVRNGSNQPQSSFQVGLVFLFHSKCFAVHVLHLVIYLYSIFACLSSLLLNLELLIIQGRNCIYRLGELS